jgi:elongation factor G
MSDLSGRRGRLLGTDKVGENRTLVKAEVPQVEITRYSIDLRSLSHGAASFSREFSRYDAMPDSAASKLK